MKTVSTRLGTACLTIVSVLALAACNGIDPVARDQAATAMSTAQQAQQTAAQATASANRTLAILARYER